MALLGLGLVLVCAIGGGELAARGAQMGSYLGLAKPLAVGQRLRLSDLARLSMRASGTTDAIPLALAASYLGRLAAANLPAGSILVPADFVVGRPPSARQALVGATLQANQAPGDLEPGDRVWVVASPQGGGFSRSSTAKAGALLARGSVFAVAPTGGTGSSALGIDLEVPLRDGPVVAEASAAGDLSLVQVPFSRSRRSS